MNEANREALRLIPNEPTLKDRQRKCIDDVFKSTKRNNLGVITVLTFKKQLLTMGRIPCHLWDLSSEVKVITHQVYKVCRILA